MIDDLRPYAEYKETGVAWLGLVPQHWPVIPNRAIFSEVKDRDHPDEDMLSVTITRGIVQQKVLLADSSKKDSSNQNKTAYKLVQPRDIAYNKMRAWQGAIGVSDMRGIISPAYVVMRLRTQQHPRFFHHLYRTPHFAKEAERWSYGITSDMWSLRPEHFKMIYTPLPPPDEQAAIVRFLDHAHGKIERVIRAKRKLIALLNEQKLAIIHRAVTRGLDTNMRFSAENHPFFENLPIHWPVMRAKLLFRQVTPPIPEGAEQVTCFRNGQVTLRSNRRTTGFTNAIWELNYQGIEPGQLVLHSMDAFAGAIGVSDSSGKCSPEYVICEPAMEGLSPYYYAHLLRSLALRGLFVALCPSVRERAPRVRFNDFGAFVLPKPPIGEQHAITEYIRETCGNIDLTLTRTEREIALLREYRTTLTAEVVTGKIDVRNAVKHIPVDVEALLPADEIGDDPGDGSLEGAEDVDE